MTAHANTTPQSHLDFVLIGDPVAHSLSPVMHTKAYEELAKVKWPFSKWRYSAVRCQDRESALYEISLVRTGRYRGMNITMPWKRLALEQADFADASADASGGANVLVRDVDYKLRAYNTDGHGAVGAIERVSGEKLAGKRVLVCGTGPTSVAIAAASAEAGSAQVVLMSRDEAKAVSCVNRVRTSLASKASSVLRGASYGEAARFVRSADVLVDATPLGMHPEDDSVVDTDLLHEGQIVLDTVYAHGTTKLVGGARERGAIAMDGLEMLVEQAALSIEIWADVMALPIEVDRSIMRTAALQRASATDLRKNDLQ
jgi:shikimate dehydrogenase